MFRFTEWKEEKNAFVKVFGASDHDCRFKLGVIEDAIENGSIVLPDEVIQQLQPAEDHVRDIVKDKAIFDEIEIEYDEDGDIITDSRNVCNFLAKRTRLTLEQAEAYYEGETAYLEIKNLSHNIEDYTPEEFKKLKKESTGGEIDLDDMAEYITQTTTLTLEQVNRFIDAEYDYEMAVGLIG